MITNPEQPVEREALVLSAILLTIGFLALSIAALYVPTDHLMIIQRRSPSTPAAWDGRPTIWPFFLPRTRSLSPVLLSFFMRPTCRLEFLDVVQDPYSRASRAVTGSGRVSLSLPVRWGAASTSTGFWFVDESLLDFVGVAGERIVGLEHCEPALLVSE